MSTGTSHLKNTCGEIEAFHLVCTHLGGKGVLHVKSGGEGVQIACKIANVLNGRPHIHSMWKIYLFSSH